MSKNDKPPAKRKSTGNASLKHVREEAEYADGIVSREEMTAISGPLPDPELLRQYETHFPGAGERILRVFETNSQATLKLDAELARSEVDIGHKMLDQYHVRQMSIINTNRLILIFGAGLVAFLFYQQTETSIIAGTVIIAIFLIAVAGTMITGRAQSNKLRVNTKAGDLEFSQEKEAEP